MNVIILLIIGILLGSFVNALVWRLKKKKNWVSERSVCTHCGHTLSALDLVPVLSYLFLRGKCRYCKNKIDDSPLTEIGLGVAFALSYYYWPYDLNTDGIFRLVIWLIALVLLTAMFLYDLRWTILPDKLTRALLVLAGIQIIGVAIINGASVGMFLASVASVAIGGGIFHLIYELSKGKYIGGGDVKLGYAYGLLLMDPLMSWMVIAIASFVGSIIALVLILLRRKSLQSKLPFGPMLIFGVFIVVLFGQNIWASVNSLMLY